METFDVKNSKVTAQSDHRTENGNRRQNREIIVSALTLRVRVCIQSTQVPVALRFAFSFFLSLASRHSQFRSICFAFWFWSRSIPTDNVDWNLVRRVCVCVQQSLVTDPSTVREIQ